MSISGSEFRSGSGFTCTNKDELFVDSEFKSGSIDGSPEADYSVILARWEKSLGFSSDFYTKSLSYYVYICRQCNGANAILEKNNIEVKKKSKGIKCTLKFWNSFTGRKKVYLDKNLKSPNFLP
jgi:hypothetical protein